MNRSIPSKTFMETLRSDRGVTFVEILITLVLLSLLMFILTSLWSRQLPAVIEDRNRSLSLAREVQLRRLLEDSFGRIQIPWWEGEYAAEQNGDSWEFPWYGGVREDRLFLSSSENRLILSASAGGEEIPLGTAVIPGLNLEVLQIFPGPENLPWFELTFSPDLTVKIPLSTAPLADTDVY